MNFVREEADSALNAIIVCCLFNESLGRAVCVDVDS